MHPSWNRLGFISFQDTGTIPHIGVVFYFQMDDIMIYTTVSIPF
jgi:hypothetical protein